ncbi:FapA family protein [Marinicrinis sediminis]|uniref:FapA family protein n=1 Tax=Marinicrinis sediminis TaxID=1652465 RepID=A0ABW5R5P9_9BACL
MNRQLERWIQVDVSSDRLEADLAFKPADDDEMVLTVGEVEQFLNAKGIKHGILSDVLAQICADPSSYYLTKSTIALGQAPVDGKDGIIDLIYPTENEELAPRKTGDGAVDLKEVRRLNNVSKGQPIAKKIPPEEGTPGISVSGDAIPCKNGKEARFKIGKNVVCDPDGSTLYAAIDGLFTFTDDGKMNVFPVYEVNGDVDYSVGNIDFIGNVVIRGNVLDGFKINAAGDIRVIGGVEGAVLEAGGSIDITAGILGHNKGHVRAAVNIKSAFIQDAHVEAGEEVIVSQSIMHSHIRAGKSVVCSGSKGLIVGGVIQAGEHVTARSIGNSMSTATTIEVGVLPELRNELTELRKKITEFKSNMDKTEKALKILDQLASTGQIDKDKLAMRIKLNNTKKQLEEDTAEAKERMLMIEKALEESVDAYIDVQHTIYGGAKIVIGRQVKFIKDEMKYIHFHLHEGEIASTGKS